MSLRIRERDFFFDVGKFLWQGLQQMLAQVAAGMSATPLGRKSVTPQLRLLLAS